MKEDAKKPFNDVSIGLRYKDDPELEDDRDNYNPPKILVHMPKPKQ